MKNLPLNGFSTIINSLTYYDIKSGNGLGSRVTKEYGYILIYGSKKSPTIYHTNKSVNHYIIKENINKYKILFFLNNPGISKNGIIGIFFCGKANHTFSDFKISNFIKKQVKKKYNNECVLCGSTENLCVDHKDDLYENKLALSIKTQTIDHFQLLCNKCNTLKRGGCSDYEYRLNKTFTNFPFLKPFQQLQNYLDFDINYIKGIKKNENRFWYDPLNFMKKLVLSICNKYKLFKQENDLLKKENDLLKKENDLLKKENDLLKK